MPPSTNGFSLLHSEYWKHCSFNAASKYSLDPSAHDREHTVVGAFIVDVGADRVVGPV